MAKIVEQFHKVMHISIEQNHVLDALSGRELLLKHIAQTLGMELYDVKVTHAKALSLMREELLKIKSA